jgi:hypothetical protein
MRSNDFLEHIALADEEISAACCIEQRICPFSVAGIANDLSLELDAIGETWPGLVVVTDMEWNNRKLANLVSCANLHFAQVQFEQQRTITGKSRSE